MGLEVHSSWGSRPYYYFSEGNDRLLVLGTSGSGKSMFTNNLCYTLKSLGYKVVYLTEKPGGAFENAFMAFEPKAQWHKKLLDFQGSTIEQQKVEIFFPLSFNLSSKKFYPEVFKPYTVSFKSFFPESWACLLNKPLGSETVNLCVNVANKCGVDDDVFFFGRKLFSSVGSLSSGVLASDFFGLGLPLAEAGDSDSVKRISSSLSFLDVFPFFVSERDSLLLDWVKVLNDKSTVSFFSYDGIKDPSLRYSLLVQNLLMLDKVVGDNLVNNPGWLL